MDTQLQSWNTLWGRVAKCSGDKTLLAATHWFGKMRTKLTWITQKLKLQNIFQRCNCVPSPPSPTFPPPSPLPLMFASNWESLGLGMGSVINIWVSTVLQLEFAFPMDVRSNRGPRVWGHLRPQADHGHLPRKSVFLDDLWRKTLTHLTARLFKAFYVKTNIF